MTYSVNLCDNPHMSEDDVLKGEQAAMKSLQRYPECAAEGRLQG